jgi:hypothetical protein
MKKGLDSTEMPEVKAIETGKVKEKAMTQSLREINLKKDIINLIKNE